MARQHRSAARSHGAARPTVVHPDSVKVRPVDVATPTAEVRRRFGGTDAFGVAAGVLTGLGLLAALAGVAAAIGRAGFSGRAEQDRVLAAVVTGLVLLLLAALTGGYVAGRVARYEGKRNGFLSGAVLSLLVAALVGVALSFDDVRDLATPGWFGAHRLLITLLTVVVMIVLVSLLAMLAGGAGARWHGRVDELLLHTRAGALAAPASDRLPVDGDSRRTATS